MYVPASLGRDSMTSVYRCSSRECTLISRRQTSRSEDTRSAHTHEHHTHAKRPHRRPREAHTGKPASRLSAAASRGGGEDARRRRRGQSMTARASFPPRGAEETGHRVAALTKATPPAAAAVSQSRGMPWRDLLPWENNVHRPAATHVPHPLPYPPLSLYFLGLLLEPVTPSPRWFIYRQEPAMEEEEEADKRALLLLAL